MASVSPASSGALRLSWRPNRGCYVPPHPTRWLAAHVVTAIKTPRWLIAVLLGMVAMSFTAVAAGRELEWEVVVHDVSSNPAAMKNPQTTASGSQSRRERSRSSEAPRTTCWSELGLPSRALPPPRRVVLPTTPTGWGAPPLVTDAIHNWLTDNLKRRAQRLAASHSPLTAACRRGWSACR